MSITNYFSPRLILMGLLGIPLFLLTTEVSAKTTIVYSVNQNTTKKNGLVQDEDGTPLIGVNVVIKGSTTGVVSDMDGKFSLNAKNGDVLIISYIGYVTREVKVTDQPMSITLSEDRQLLDEVIVIGYGTTTRKSAVGAVDQVKKEMLENRPVTNITQALQGAAPNLIIQTREFDPAGQSTNINVRGVSSLNDNTPLIVIDGIVSDQTALDDLSPMDVDNVTVLKDAGSAAIYGSRSASGVILVTTKSGKKDSKPKVRLSSSIGWEAPYFFYEPVSVGANARYRNLANTNVGKDPYFTNAEIADLEKHGNHWAVNEVLQTGLQQSHSLSVSGGSNRSTYMLSLGYYDQESNLVGNDDFGKQRYNFRANISTEIGLFKLTGIIGYNRTNYLTTSGNVGNILGDASTAPPYYTYQMKDNQGRYIVNDKWSERNPLGMLEGEGTKKSRRNAVNINLSADFNPHCSQSVSFC